MRVDQIEIHVGAVGFEYQPVRHLEAKCEARTNFSRTPTIAEANAKLQEMAAGIGADAVLDVKYDSGMSMTSWRSLKATGLAVKKVSDERICPKCAETIKRAATVCRFCSADLPAQGAAPSLAPMGSSRPDVQTRTVPREPLKATDNSQIGIWLAIGGVVLLAIIGAMAS